MNIRRTTLSAAALLGALAVAGCAPSAPSPEPTFTVTAAPPAAPAAQKFTAATSGKVLAARILARARPKDAGVKITGMECKNFPNIRVGTHTDCQVMVNGGKRGYLVTFTERDGHYVVKPQKLTW